ncbi:hypothetical protein GCM10009133_33760 [Cocleimonas flava]|uniref:Spy/CpxP family protein refolding chaperone n=1 Tax=Cocleimonas flava TaxID=634765 RepID=A0A4R1FD75_9GAMM|nr:MULTISPECIES: hypothetical protein [Cocleimonas]MEB8431089.1 hypothetical protein [Cocleimonas sp. KMM 6892]MEC4714139.1 hypothetical protein [Cocleimonas sp. KMM 6895]MEC4743470.1 hypothetical protein [Cocleimonas sp. KMM 6896]TCJ88781.1 hypothetical protein EV695_0640 [Cocleimonas flava]
MKPIISMCLIALLATTSVYADISDGTENKKGPRQPDIDQVVSSLQLEDSKAQQLKMLLESHQQEMKTLREQSEQIREIHRNIREQHQKALLALLGYENLYKFEETMSEYRPMRGKR